MPLHDEPPLDDFLDNAVTVSWIELDVVRYRGSHEEVRAVAARDGYGTKIWIPRDPGSTGVDQADSMIRMLPGYPIAAERRSGDKATRAAAAASQANIGRIGMSGRPGTPPSAKNSLTFRAVSTMTV
jgi:phage terminase large subunit-like protein